MMDIIKLALDNAELKKRIEVLQDLLSSSYNIANRNGEQTHWQRFAGQLHVNGISPVTPKTFKILPSDTEYAQSAQPTPSQSVVDEPYAYEAVYENKTCVLIYDDGELDPDNVEVWGSYELNPLYRRAQLNTKPTNTDEWVRVPIEPTEEMWVAGSSAYRNGNRLASPVSRIYKAMINAISQDKGESV